VIPVSFGHAVNVEHAKSQPDPTCHRRMNYQPSSWRWPAVGSTHS
jgi:hypothetical protein